MACEANGRKGVGMGDEEGSTWLRSAATSLAIATIVLVLVNAVLVVRNQGAQREVNQRQQVINQGVQIAHVSQVLVETAARAAVQNKDDKLTALLERHGIHITLNPPQTLSAPAGAKP
jgi:acylphosphatase